MKSRTVPARPVLGEVGDQFASSSATIGIRRPSTARTLATTANWLSSGTRAVTSTASAPCDGTRTVCGGSF